MTGGIENRVYDLMFKHHLSRDEAYGQATREGLRHKGR